MIFIPTLNLSKTLIKYKVKIYRNQETKVDVTNITFKMFKTQNAEFGVDGRWNRPPSSSVEVLEAFFKFLSLGL
jgi:hypothetical protein